MSREKSQRLGRGLGALLGDEFLASGMDGSEVRNLPFGAVASNPYQPRRNFDEDDLEDLSRSIRENGLLQPVVVRKAPRGEGRYELVAGERRLRAIGRLGWSEVPAVVRDVDDRTLLVLALVENIQREALNPIEEAEGFQLLAEEFDLTQAEIARAVGKNRATVANTLRLLRLPPSLRRCLLDGSLNMGHARALLSVGDPGRMVELGRRAAREGWSVREVESRVRRQGKSEGASTDGRGPRERREDPVMRELQEALREAVGARVSIRKKGRAKGVIEVPFHSAEDFERVFQMITGRDASEFTG